MLQAMYDECGAKQNTSSSNGQRSEKKPCASSSKGQKKRKTLEPPCKSSKKYIFFQEMHKCVDDAVRNTSFAPLPEDGDYEDLLAVNQERLFLKLKDADKAKYFKAEDWSCFCHLARRFLFKANFCLQVQLKKKKFSLEKALNNPELEAFVAAHFEKLVENGVADADDKDVAWVCPKGHHEDNKRYCDCEDVNPETNEGKKCFKPVCIVCDPQKQAFDVCKICNNPDKIEQMTNVFELREKHEGWVAKIESRKTERVKLLEEYKIQEEHPFYHHINQKALYETIGVPVDTKRPYTKEEAAWGATCYGPAHDIKTKMKVGALPPKPEATCRYMREKEVMNANAVTKRVEEQLKLAKNGLLEKPVNLDKVNGALNLAEDLVKVGKCIISQADFFRFNALLQDYEDSLYKERYPSESGDVHEPVDLDEPAYGSGLEDDEEEEDGHGEHDLMNEDLKKKDELDLMMLLASSDDEE